MADYAHKYTDQQLEALEKRFQSVYRQAEREVNDKLMDYLHKYKAKDDAKRKLLDEGKITEKEYKDWRYGQMMTGKRWKEMRDKLAQEYTSANELAMRALKHQMPDVFAENVNYSTYDIEQMAGVDTSFTLYDRQTVDRLLRDNPELLPQPSVDIPKDLRWNRQKIQGAIEQGILQGESIPKIAKRLQKVTDMNKSAATRNARTAMTGAQNGGRIESYKRAKELGIDIRQCWLATMDGRVRHSHAVMDGETQEVGKEFSNGCAYPGDPNGPPAEIYNCFVGDTEIASDSEIIRSYKHVYYGDLINIKTSGGVDFTCTPNHPILSDSGWISAARLRKGDNLVVASVGNIHMSRRNPNIDHVHTRIDAFHEFFNEIFGHRACNLGVNFHGDIPATDVEIVTKEGLLRICLNSALFKRFYKFMFKSANESFTGNSAFMKHFRCICKAAFSFVRCMDKPFTFLNRRLLHSDKHSLRPISGSDFSVSQNAINDLTTKSEAVSEALTRFPGQISVDKVVDVKIIPSRSSGIHVYNLQTNNGYYFVNSSIAQNAQKCNGNFAIAHNCRCTLIAQLKGFEHDVSQGRFSKLDDMSYDEWKEYHRQALNKQNKIMQAKPEFTEAKSIEDAEKYADKFVSSYKSKFTGKVDYKGIDLKYANEMNRAMNDVFSSYSPKEKIRNITPFNMREKRFKDTTAEAAYQYGIGDLFYNKSYYKNAKSFEAHKKQYDDLLKQVTDNIDQAISISKNRGGIAGSMQQKYMEALKETGRTNVYGPDAYGSTIHELGHYLDDNLFRKSMKQSGFSLSESFEKYSGKISAYATSSQQEYMAESFAAFWKGERRNIDPKLIKIFEEAKK